MDKAAGLTAEAAEKAEAGRVRTHTGQQAVAAKEGHVVGQHTVDESAAGQLRHLTQVDTSQELTTTLKRTAQQATATRANPGIVPKRWGSPKEPPERVGLGEASPME